MKNSKLNHFGFPIYVEEFTQEDIDWLINYLNEEGFNLSNIYDQNRHIGYYVKHTLISSKKVPITGQILPLFSTKRIDLKYFYTKLNDLMQWLGDYEILKRQNQKKLIND